MSEKRFTYGETDLFEWVEDNGKMISTKECVNKLNEQQATIEQLERKLELKTEEVEYLKRMMVKWGMVKDE